MQKKNLVIFSLLTFSILFIAGCQEAVGGNVGTRGLITDPYERHQIDLASREGFGISTSDSTFATGDVISSGRCLGTLREGQPVYVTTTPNLDVGDCYVVLSCVTINLDEYTRSGAGDLYSGDLYSDGRISTSKYFVKKPTSDQFCQGARDRIHPSEVVIFG